MALLIITGMKCAAPHVCIIIILLFSGCQSARPVMPAPVIAWSRLDFTPRAPKAPTEQQRQAMMAINRATGISEDIPQTLPMPPQIDCIPLSEDEKTALQKKIGGSFDTMRRLKEHVPPKVRPPVYPFAVAKRNENGTVDLIVRVSTNGKIYPTLVVSATSQELVEAVVVAMRRWEPKPSTEGYYRIQFDFTIKDSTSRMVEWK